MSAIAEDLNGNFWIGTDGGGLDLARPDGSVVKVFRHDPNDSTSLPANTVYAIAVDAAGRVWIGTDGGGLALVVGSAAAPDSIRFQDALARGGAVERHDLGRAQPTPRGTSGSAAMPG